MKLIVPYMNPDIDGLACAIGYREYLDYYSIPCVAAIFGKPSIEALFVMNYISAPQLNNAELYLESSNEIILVDASDSGGVPEVVDFNKISEVIDHRLYFKKDCFPNAKFQVELVGAAATLIEEKFHIDSIQISEKTAFMLYSAIISNTINFKANVTTERDIKASQRLLKSIKLPKNWIKLMFDFKTKNLEISKEAFLKRFSNFYQLNSTFLIITQVEISNVEKFIHKNKQRLLEIFYDIRSMHNSHLFLFSFIDIKNGFNVFFTEDRRIKRILSQLFGIQFVGSIAKYNKIVMRKEIVPLIENYMKR